MELMYICTLIWGMFSIFAATDNKAGTRQPDANITPDYGPVSGGTIVTITGILLDSLVEIRLGEHHMLNITHRDGDKLMAITPPYSNTSFEAETVEEHNIFFVTLLYNNGDREETAMQFRYKPDPEVVDIYPRKMVESGGTTVTVKGFSLDSVAAPMLTLTAINRSNPEQQQTFHSPCSVKTTQELTCITPSMLNNLQENNNDLDILLGLRFDGANNYEDLTDNLPHLANMEVHQNPGFNTSQVFFYNPKTEGPIGIKGEHIDAGVVVAEYEVSIGKGFCTDIGISRDTLYCTPPSTLADISDSGNTARDYNEANIMVRVGAGLEYPVGYIEYDISIPMYTMFVPVVAALSVLLVVVMILIICFFGKRRVNKNTEKPVAPKSQDLGVYEPPGNNHCYEVNQGPIA